jgi:glycerol-3-phosphate acyltransferase PlsX
MLDLGANVDCSAEHLLQFAQMGAALVSVIDGKERPSIGLLNIGEEVIKGNDTVKLAAELLRASSLNFYGNVEGDDIFKGTTDVIVCDGFVGNVVLKFAEAVGGIVLNILKEELPQGWRGQLGTLLLKPNLKRIKQRIDHAEHGGALLFGVDGICIISHGSSRAPSIFNAIRLAKEAYDNRVSERIQSWTDGIDRSETSSLLNSEL